MKQKLFTAVLLMGVCSAPLLAAEAPKKPWKNATELSVVSSNGNSKAQSTSGKNTFNYLWELAEIELIGGGYGARNDGSTIAERYFASEKLSYKLSDRNFIYEKFAWDKDRFSGIRNRFDGGLGVGRELVKTTRNFFVGEVGGGYISEERIGSKDERFAAGRLYGKYKYTLSETSDFTQDAEYMHNFENPDDFRSKTETAVTAAINTSMSLKLSYVWKHSGRPPTGFLRNDTSTMVSLVATY